MRQWTDETRTALELIAECVARLRMTDPADTAAALLAAWHGFGTAKAAGTLLAQDNLDDAVLARNTRPVFGAVIERLRPAPSLPYPLASRARRNSSPTARLIARSATS